MEIYTDRERLLLGFLFRATIKAKRGLEKRTLQWVEEDNPDHPERFHWHWILRGAREHCGREIHDDRIAELVGRPYRDSQGDPSFFDSRDPAPNFREGA